MQVSAQHAEPHLEHDLPRHEVGRGLHVTAADAGRRDGVVNFLIAAQRFLAGPEQGVGLDHSLLEELTGPPRLGIPLSLIHISEPTRLLSISYAVFCLK